jgi:hypothetical protein
VQGANRLNTRTSFDNFALSSSFAMLFVMTIVFVFLTWYLDKVLPSEFGVPQHPLFFVSPSYWRKKCACCAARRPLAAGAAPSLKLLCLLCCGCTLLCMYYRCTPRTTFPSRQFCTD